jgi:hypothetical protein
MAQRKICVRRAVVKFWLSDFMTACFHLLGTDLDTVLGVSFMSIAH